MIGLLGHDCPTPLRSPVVEEQRVWTCPDCSTQWRWDRTSENSIGWVRGEKVPAPELPVAVVPKCSNPDCPQCRGAWDIDEPRQPKHTPWWWPLPASWLPHRW